MTKLGPKLRFTSQIYSLKTVLIVSQLRVDWGGVNELSQSRRYEPYEDID